MKWDMELPTVRPIFVSLCKYMVFCYAPSRTCPVIASMSSETTSPRETSCLPPYSMFTRRQEDVSPPAVGVYYVPHFPVSPFLMDQ